jgi:spermidine synthase
MKKETLLDRAAAPDGKELTLVEKDGVYTIRVGGAELMSTRRHHSEEELARLGCARLSGQKDAHVLIGGLGFGFTLKAALESLPSSAKIVVAELLEPVVRWNQDPRYPLCAAALADKRVDLRLEDVANLLASPPLPFHAILMDVDNGPAGLTAARNDDLYRPEGLLLAKHALAPTGCLAVWSASGSPSFEKAMARAGFRVETKTVSAHGSSGSRHTIFLGFT